MKTKVFLRLFGLVLLLIIITHNAHAQSEPIRGLDAYVAKALKDWEVPGFALVIAEDAKPSLTWEKYIGTYKNEMNSDGTVKKQQAGDGVLSVTRRRDKPLAVRHVSSGLV